MRCCWFVGFFPIFAFVPSTRDVVCSISDRAARKYMCLLGAHCACVRALFRIFVYLYSVKWVSGIVLNWPVHGDWHTEEEAHKKSGQHTKFTRSLHVYTLSDNIGCYYLYRLEFNVRCISIFDRFALHPASIRHWLRIVPCGCVCECVQAIPSKCALVNLAKSKMLPSVYWMDTNLCYTISFIFLSLSVSRSLVLFPFNIPSPQKPNHGKVNCECVLCFEAAEWQHHIYCSQNHHFRTSFQGKANKPTSR